MQEIYSTYYKQPKLNQEVLVRDKNFGVVVAKYTTVHNHITNSTQLEFVSKIPGGGRKIVHPDRWAPIPDFDEYDCCYMQDGECIMHKEHCPDSYACEYFD